MKTIAGNKKSKAGPRIGHADGATSRVPNGVGKNNFECLFHRGRLWALG